MRFVQNLLPLLNCAGPSRVVGVHGGGFEASINPDDLDLRHTFSLMNACKHSITMTSLSMDHLSQSHPAVSFIHAYPGLVGANIYSNSFPAPVAPLYNYEVWPLIWPFFVGLQGSGERNLFHLSSARHPAHSHVLAQFTPITDINWTQIWQCSIRTYVGYLEDQWRKCICS